MAGAKCDPDVRIDFNPLSPSGPLRHIDGLANELRLRLGELEEGDETLVRTLEDLSAFSAYALPLIDELDTLPAAADWGEWLDRLAALATRALREPDRVLAVLAP